MWWTPNWGNISSVADFLLLGIILRDKYQNKVNKNFQIVYPNNFHYQINRIFNSSNQTSPKDYRCDKRNRPSSLMKIASHGLVCLNSIIDRFWLMCHINKFSFLYPSAIPHQPDGRSDSQTKEVRQTNSTFQPSKEKQRKHSIWY